MVVAEADAPAVVAQAAGCHMRVNAMLARDSVKQRLAARPNESVSLAELTYQAFQVGTSTLLARLSLTHTHTLSLPPHFSDDRLMIFCISIDSMGVQCSWEAATSGGTSQQAHPSSGDTQLVTIRTVTAMTTRRRPPRLLRSLLYVLASPCHWQ